MGKCKDCKYYESHRCNEETMKHRKLPGNACEKITNCENECDTNDYNTGFCSRFPPTEKTSDNINIPITVLDDNWCGEFQPKK